MKYTVAIPTIRKPGYPFAERLMDCGIRDCWHLYYSRTGNAVFDVESSEEAQLLLILKLGATIIENNKL